MEKTLQSNPVRRFNRPLLRRSNLTPLKHSIWSMYNSEVYTFNCRINRGSILVRRTEVNLSDYSTLRLCRYFFPKLSSHKLSHIADHLWFQLNHHNALSDAETAAKISIHTIPKVGIEAFNLENENITYNLR